MGILQVHGEGGLQLGGHLDQAYFGAQEVKEGRGHRRLDRSPFLARGPLEAPGSPWKMT